MEIRAKIEQDFKKAYRNKERDKASVLSLLKSAIKNAEISQKREKLSEEKIFEVIKQEIKQRKEAVSEWKKAGREEEARKEEKAIAILEQYLPQAMSREEIEKEARKVIEEMGAESSQDFGKVMGSLMPRLKGRAEGGTVSEIVNRLLCV